jgi:hypothetical protein
MTKEQEEFCIKEGCCFSCYQQDQTLLIPLWNNLCPCCDQCAKSPDQAPLCGHFCIGPGAPAPSDTLESSNDSGGDCDFQEAVEPETEILIETAPTALDDLTEPESLPGSVDSDEDDFKIENDERVRNCSGCNEGLLNQLGHMSPGGCLFSEN